MAESGSGNAFARRYSGFFNAVVPGKYQFSLTSDDGSFLWLDGAPAPLIDDNQITSGPDCGAIPSVPKRCCAWQPACTDRKLPQWDMVTLDGRAKLSDLV